MEDFIATQWIWLVASLLVGFAIGYRFPRQTPDESGFRRLAIWGAAACLAVLAEIICQSLAFGAATDLGPYLWIAFAFAIGGMIGSWARQIRARAELARAILAGNARVEGAVLGARAKATVRSDQDADAHAQASQSSALQDQAPETPATESARLDVEPETAEVPRDILDERIAGHESVARDDEHVPEAATAQAAPPAAAVAMEAKAVEAAPRAEVARSAVAVGAEPTDASYPGSRPQGIAAPADGEADDLKMIRGVGPRNEKACNVLGIYRFRQIAAWTPDEAIWVGHHLAFPGRIEREHWIAQAALLASGVETEHSKAVKSGAVTVHDNADEPLDAIAAEAFGKNLPQRTAPIDGEHKHAGQRPPGITTPMGKADDLKQIRGIGPRNAGRLHQLGIWHFSQIAAWNEDHIKWVGSFLAFSGRIHREDWVAQARQLASGEAPVKKINKVKSSQPVATVALPESNDAGPLADSGTQQIK
jgi:predicted flap endonuclease-1-like 5' DNA nuclease